MSAATKFSTAAANRRSDPISLALEGLVSRYASVVRDAAQRHSLSECDIDEVIQGVRIRVWRALATSEKISAAPASYVYRTAVSAALDLIRRRRARREHELERFGEGLPARSGGVQPDQMLDESELISRLARALADLSRSRRVVVRMHLLGYHRNEIAELLGWTEAKTRNLLYRGLSDLRTRLKNDEREPERRVERRQASGGLRADRLSPGRRRAHTLHTTG
jgi:RNA polymerase sigma factor (sigma-70 family)